MHISDAAVSVELETPDMTLNIGPQHPSTHGVLRLVAKVDGERVGLGGSRHRLHAPRVREAHRGADVRADHSSRQPHRLGVRLCERGAVHHRRRAARRHRGSRAGAMDPSDPHRDDSDLLPPLVHVVLPARAGRRHTAHVRTARTRARDGSHRGSHRWALSPELQPGRRREARSGRRLDAEEGHPGSPRRLAPRHT